MKKPALLIFVLLLSMTARSQVDSAMYGISVAMNPPGLFLSRIDVITGTVETISEIPVALFPGGQGRTIDPLNRIFYYASENHLLAFDLKSGELIRETTITTALPAMIFGIAWNYRDSTLYALAADTADPGIRLVMIDPASGIVSTVSAAPVAPGCIVLPSTALDPVHGICYVQTVGNPSVHLLGIDLQSGTVVTDVPVGTDPGQQFGPMEYSCRDSSLYGLTGSFKKLRKLARINPLDGTVTVISTFPSVDTILNEQATIDPFQQIFYFEAMDRTLRGIDLTSGDLVQVVKVNPLPGTYFTSFLFNHACYVHKPSALNENTRLPALHLFPIPASDYLQIRSSIPFYQIEILDLAGSVVQRDEFIEISEIRLDIPRLRAGMYIIRIFCEASIVSSKFVKTEPK